MVKLKKKQLKSTKKSVSNGVKKAKTKLKSNKFGKKIPSQVRKHLGKLSSDHDFDDKNSDSEELSESELMQDSEDEAVVDDDVVNDSDESLENEDDDIEEDDDEDLEEKHKRDLEKLKETDPEFYQFLQDNDKKLLQFNLSDDEQEENDKDGVKDEKVHKPSDDLEVASDESDFEADDDEKETKDNRIITLKIIKKWHSEIQTDKSNKTIVEVSRAFHAALKTVTNTEEDDDEPTHYIVEGSAVFNAVIQLCVLELGPAVRKYLGLQHGSKQPPHKCKRFPKIKRVLKSYFTDLLKLLLGVTSANIQTVLLKHLHYVSPMLNSFPNITKPVVKRLIHLWGTADEAVRVVAFFCILRITYNQQASILDTVLKSMYMTYVKNSKFVSQSSLASINFMRRSLVEMFALDINVSYSHVFLYIRQLAIHLRNAITLNKKENIQAVYNWQFVSSLRLWGNLLAVTFNKEQMQQLVYPFVQVCLGTIKLVPTAQYYPLRFHVVQVLIDLTKETGVFIPVLPFLLEVLTTHDFDKKHQKVSMKPILITSLLRLSKSQMQENGFKDMLIENVYGLLLEYLTAYSHTIAFPDLSLICIMQLKQFIKKCKNANYTRKLKQVLEKVEQNCKFIENERAKATFLLTDFKQIEGWESQIKNKGTPLAAYFESWSKLRNIKKNKQLTNNDELGDYKLPSLKKTKVKAAEKSDGPVELFPSDSESEDDDFEKKKPRRGKRGGKNVNKKTTDDSVEEKDSGENDIVEDLKMDDW